MVVLNFQIAVTPQALRDHQVMRFIARRKQRRGRQPAVAAAPVAANVARKMTTDMVDTCHRAIARAVIRRDCHSTHTCSAMTDSQTTAPSGPDKA